MLLNNRRTWVCILIFILVLLKHFLNLSFYKHQLQLQDPNVFCWDTLPEHYPVPIQHRLPSGRARRLPKLQADFPAVTDLSVEDTRVERLKRVRSNFEHAWTGYKTHAWRKGGLAPLSSTYRDTLGGWAATLVDSLDTLWIMGFRDDFDTTVQEVAKLNFSTSIYAELNLFETNIRYIGGFLAAYDLSGNEILFRKAVELGNMLYVAFDTPNHMPITRWKWQE